MTTAARGSGDSVTLPDGRQLAYRSYGDPAGSPVVYCHGGLSAPSDIAFADGRAKERSVHLLAVARPGIGASTRRPGHRVADWADDVGALTTALGIEAFSVLGWSAGGPYALACCGALGSRVRAVATVGGMAPLDPPLTAGQLGLSADRILFPLARRSHAAAAAVLRVSMLLPDRMSQRMVMRSGSEADRTVIGAMSPAAFMADLTEAVRHGPHGVVDDYVALGRGWGFTLEDLAARVTLFQGEEDTLLPRRHAETLAARLPHGRLEMVEGAGHFLLHTHLDGVLDALT